MRYQLPQLRLFAWIALPVLSVLIVFVATADGAARANKDPAALARFISGTVTRSADITYITEQDSEVFAFYRNQPVKEITDTVFLALIRRPARTPIIQQSWSKFFQLRIQTDPTGRWLQLRDYLEANLTNLIVFRVLRDAPYDSQYDLYAIGIFGGDTVVGVQMFGVAT